MTQTQGVLALGLALMSVPLGLALNGKGMHTPVPSGTTTQAHHTRPCCCRGTAKRSKDMAAEIEIEIEIEIEVYTPATVSPIVIPGDATRRVNL